MTEYQQPVRQIEYIELMLDAPATEEEFLTMLLFEHGAEGVEIADPEIVLRHLAAHDWDASVYDHDILRSTGRIQLRILLPADEVGMARVDEILAKVASMPDVKTSTQVLPPVDWQEQWKAGFTSRSLGKRLWLRPRWLADPIPEGKTELVIDPGMAFGTGDHPTTEMALVLLEKYLPPQAQVIDLGCGSGILAIAAILLGADSAFAVDIDEVCAAVIEEHIKLNKLPTERLEFQIGDILQDTALQKRLAAHPADLVMANITAQVICELVPHIGSFLAQGGSLIFSGILTEYADEVLNVLDEAGWAVNERLDDQGWVALAVGRRADS